MIVVGHNFKSTEADLRSATLKAALRSRVGSVIQWHCLLCWAFYGGRP